MTSFGTHTSLNSLKADMVITENCLLRIKHEFRVVHIYYYCVKQVMLKCIYVILQIAFIIPISSLNYHKRSFSLCDG